MTNEEQEFTNITEAFEAKVRHVISKVTPHRDCVDDQAVKGLAAGLALAQLIEKSGGMHGFNEGNKKLATFLGINIKDILDIDLENGS